MPKGSRSAAEIIGAVEITLLFIAIHSFIVVIIVMHTLLFRFSETFTASSNRCINEDNYISSVWEND